MVLSYYPGCTLKGRAQEVDRQAKACARALGITLEELADWQCCGGAYPVMQDEIAPRLPAARALSQAADLGGTLVTICSGCHHVLKRVNNDILTNGELKKRINAYLELDLEYNATTKVLHYLEMLKYEVGFSALKSAVVKPIEKRIAPYYGCMLLRPSDVMRFDDAEAPSIMEDFIRAIGGYPVDYSMKNECCGSYASVKNRQLTVKSSGEIVSSAKRAGADVIITACPLCYYNLLLADKSAPVLYFTQLLAEALGVAE